MHKHNWKQYNRQLVQRGSLTFLIDPKTIKSKGQKSLSEQVHRITFDILLSNHRRDTGILADKIGTLLESKY